jgi:hypothetical protein
MRLTDTPRTFINEEVQRHVGDNAFALLFGSQVRDDAWGGDIDLHIGTDGSVPEGLDRELSFYAALQCCLREQRFDIFVHRRRASLRSFDLKVARTGTPP